MANGSVSSQNNVHPGVLKNNGEYSDARVLTLKEIFILTGLPENWNPPKWASENLIRQVIGEGVPPKLINKLLETMPLTKHINENKIEITGSKTTIPDFLIEFKNGEKLLMELKSAAFEKIPMSIIMIDLVNRTFEIKNLKYFINLHPFVNHAMEGQLCYDFPRVISKINDLINKDIYQYVDNDIFNFEVVKKYIVLAKASANKAKKGKATTLKKYTTLINKKIKLEELKEELLISQEDFNNKIVNIKSKYPDVEKSWDEINNQLDKLLEM